MCGGFTAQPRFTRKQVKSRAIPCHRRSARFPRRRAVGKQELVWGEGTPQLPALSSSEAPGRSPRSRRFKGAGTLSPLRNRCSRSSWFNVLEALAVDRRLVACDGNHAAFAQRRHRISSSF